MIKVVLDTNVFISDNKVIECAVEAKASFVVSGDKHLLEIKKYKGIKIVSPKEFLLRV